MEWIATMRSDIAFQSGGRGNQAKKLIAAQLRTVEQLVKKLQIDRANVIRLAVAKLAESEGVGTTHRG